MKINPSNHTTSRSISDTRLIFWRACLIASFALLGIALVMFQIFGSDRWAGLALKNRLRIVRLAPTRGQIYDRNGLPLALNVMTFDIMGYPLDLHEEVKEKLLAALERADISMTSAELDSRIKNLTWAPYRAISLVPNLTLLQMAGLMEDPEFPDLLFPMPYWRRTYPAGPLVSHIVGYVGEISPAELREAETPDGKGYIGGDIIGKSGVEKFYEQQLRGSVGEQAIEVDARGRRRSVLEERQAGVGDDLTLTIDLSAQAYATKLLGDYKASLIVIDVRNGEIIVLCSTPSYDPNPLSWGVSAAEWAALNEDPARPMLNRAISGQYSPGSIFKVVTGYAALESGIASRDFTIFCPGVFKIGTHAYHCWLRRGHGKENILRALRDSCDVFFYETSQLVGIKNYFETGTRFKLGKQLGIDLPGEAPGLLPSAEWKREATGNQWYRGDSANMSIGQGYLLLTPLQMCSLYATIANDGIFYRPHVRRDAQVEGEKIGLNPDNVKIIKEGLRAVVARGGTGHPAALEGLDMAGKTGTVQHAHGKDHAVFAAYAPTKNPRYAAVCFIEGGESGGHVAGPICARMLEWILERNPATE